MNQKKEKRKQPSFGLRLLKERKIFLTKDINSEVAHQLMSQLFFLESLDPEKEITLYINSPGGEVTSGLAIFDTMKHIKPPVISVVAGLAASMASIILAGGEKGRRAAFPNSRVLIHQPLGGVRGQATDIEIHAREILKVKERLNKLLSRLTGQTLSVIERDTNRDFWMTAEEAKAYGLVDEILEPAD